MTMQNQKAISLETLNFNLNILRIGYFNSYEITGNPEMPQRTCYDYEIDFYLRSDGGIFCDGIWYPMHEGEINIRKPGEVVQGVGPYECYVLCFDLTGKTPKEDYLFGTPNEAQCCYQNPLLSTMPHRMRPQKQQHFAKLFEALYHSFQQKDDYHIFRTKQLLHDILGEIFYQISYEHNLFSSVNPQVIHASQYIRANFCEAICIKELVKKSGLSNAYFHKCFKAYTGFTPLAFLMFLRIEKAKELLFLTNSDIYEIAAVCGYEDPVYFSCLFKKATGFTPTQYRKMKLN